MLQSIKTLAASPLFQACAAALLLTAVQRAMPYLRSGHLRGALTGRAGSRRPVPSRPVQGGTQAAKTADTHSDAEDLAWHHWMS